MVGRHFGGHSVAPWMCVVCMIHSCHLNSWEYIWVIWACWVKPPHWPLGGERESSGKDAMMPRVSRESISILCLKHGATCMTSLQLLVLLLSQQHRGRWRWRRDCAHGQCNHVILFGSYRPAGPLCSWDARKWWVPREQLWGTWIRNLVDFLKVVSSSVPGMCEHAFLSVPSSQNQKWFLPLVPGSTAF